MMVGLFTDVVEVVGLFITGKFLEMSMNTFTGKCAIDSSV